MSARRCPNCGGLVGADAEWCGQCLARLDQATAAARAEGELADGATGEAAAERARGGDTPSGALPGTGTSTPGDVRGDGMERRTTAGTAGHAVRRTSKGIVWDCPTCGEPNPIELTTCPVCRTPFARLFEPPEEGPRIDPGRAAALSLVFPGVGHYAAGRRADGVARAVVFAFALATGLLTLFGGGGGSTLFVMVMALSLGGAAALYVLSTLDAGRAAQGVSPIISTRMLLYGAVGLMLLTLVLLTVATMQASPPARG